MKCTTANSYTTLPKAVFLQQCIAWMWALLLRAAKKKKENQAPATSFREWPCMNNVLSQSVNICHIVSVEFNVLTASDLISHSFRYFIIDFENRTAWVFADTSFIYLIYNL